MKKRTSALDKILGRLDDLDSVNLTNLVQRLARERRLLETVFDTIQDGILVLDQSGIIQYSNFTANRLLGIRDHQIGSLTLWKLIPDLIQALDIYYTDRMPDQQDRVISQELELTYPEKRFVRLYMVPLDETFSSGSEGGFAMVLSDITEEKVSTQEMIENERVSSIMNLSAGVAHELGNPLNSLNIHLQLMERQLQKMKPSPDRDKLAAQVSICKGEVDRLDHIIEHFLDAVRPQPPDLGGELDIHEALAEVLKVLEGELQNRGIEIDVEVTPNLPSIIADRNQIKQVLFNIIKNAMEATPKGGRLEMRTTHDEEYVQMIVADNGQGISQDDMSKVFTPYFTTKSDGHGLGMMIVQRIMRDHGGQIRIDSREGTGTTVSLRFPRKDRRARLLETD